MPTPGPEDWLNGPGKKNGDRKGQKFSEWAHDTNSRIGPGGAVTAALKKSRKIMLVPLGDCSGVDTDALLNVLRAFYYGLEVELAPVEMTVNAKQRKSRGYGTQLLCRDVHKQLQLVKARHKAFVAVGFTMYDLYPKPGWNFVFGSAWTSQGTGIFSFSRYKYIEDDDDNIIAERTPIDFTRRCLQVLCHEVGHLFHFKHCVYWECLMNGSNGDWESDLRPIGLCPMDLAKLQACLGFDLAEREAALAAAFAEVGIPHFASFHARQGELLTAEPGAGCACCGPEVAA